MSYEKNPWRCAPRASQKKKKTMQNDAQPGSLRFGTTTISVFEHIYNQYQRKGRGRWSRPSHFQRPLQIISVLKQNTQTFFFKKDFLISYQINIMYLYSIIYIYTNSCTIKTTKKWFPKIYLPIGRTNNRTGIVHNHVPLLSLSRLIRYQIRTRDLISLQRSLNIWYRHPPFPNAPFYIRVYVRTKYRRSQRSIQYECSKMIRKRQQTLCR